MDATLKSIQEAYGEMISETWDTSDEVFFHPHRLQLTSFKDKRVTSKDHDEAIKYYQEQADMAKNHKHYPYAGMRAHAEYHQMRADMHMAAKAKIKNDK